VISEVFHCLGPSRALQNQGDFWKACGTPGHSVLGSSRDSSVRQSLPTGQQFERPRTVSPHVGLPNRCAACLQVSVAIGCRTGRLGIGRYKISPWPGKHCHRKVGCIGMATGQDFAGFGDSPFTEWYEVGVSTVHLSNSCSQNLVSRRLTPQPGLRCL